MIGEMEMKELNQSKVALRCNSCNKKLLDIGALEADIVMTCPRCKTECRMDIQVDGIFYYRPEPVDLGRVAEAQLGY